jgi:ABC-type bacteriocin/lantibiotic exporter with double-glycine peptidase domain
MISGRLSPLARTVQLLAFDRGDLGLVVIYGVGVGLVSLAVPVTVQALVNTVAFGTLIQPVVVLTLLLFVALSGGAALRALQIRIVEMIQRRLFVRVSDRLAHQLPRVPRETMEERNGPELMNRFLDVFGAKKSIGSIVVDGVDAVLVALVGMALLAVYHPLLLLFDLVLIIVAFVVFFVPGRRGIRTSVEESRPKYEVTEWFEEMARHSFALRTVGGRRFAAERADALSRKYLTQRDGHFRLVFRQVVSVLALEAVASVALLGLGATLVIERQLSLGQLVAAELVISSVVVSLGKLGQKLENFYDLLAAVHKVGRLLDLPVEASSPDSSEAPPTGGRPLALRLVEPLPEGSDGGERVSVRVDAGQALAVTGTERQTLALVERLLRQPNGGEGYVRLDGRDTRELPSSVLYAEMALVRWPELFPGTIAENLRMGAPDASVGDLGDALERVGLAARVRSLPEGIYTQLTRSGAPLTDSETLQLTIARALLAGAGVLVLDRALDRMAPEVRRRTMRALFSERRVTLFVVSGEEEVHAHCDLHLDLSDTPVPATDAPTPVQEVRS